MKQNFKPFFAILLALILILSCFSGVNMVFANETATTVTLTFVGENKSKAGFAESEITITPGENAATEGYYLVYYTDGEKILTDYNEVTAIKINNGQPVAGKISHGIMIPAEAKGIAVFEHRTYYSSQNWDIAKAVATAPIPDEKQNPDLGEKQFSFGALSDTHMNYEQHGRGAYAKLKDSMDFYAKQKMDMVLIAGDVTGDRGETPDLEAQYTQHVSIINDSDFSLENVYEAIGNHGNTPADAPLLTQYLGNTKEQHPYENSPYYSVLFKNEGRGNDNLFIFMAQELNSPGESAAYDNFSKEQIDWVESVFQQYGETNTNLFVVLHSPFLKFGAGDKKDGTYTACISFNEEYTQTLRLKALLEEYKHAVVMSGHTHVSFYENVNYSNEYGTFAHTVHIGSNSQPCAYGEQTSLQKSTDGRRGVSKTYGSEGYTVDVYSNYIVYTGYNFSTGKKIPAACFMIPTKPYVGSEPEDPVQPDQSSTPETPTNPVVSTLGDVNGDKKIDAKDALAVLKYTVGKMSFTQNQFQAAEVTGDGVCNAIDALEILKYSVNKIGSFPIEGK